LILANLLVNVPRPGDSEETFSVFESSCHGYNLTNHSKVEAIPLSALSMDTTSELGSCEHQLFKSLLVWLDEGIEPRSTDDEANAMRRLYDTLTLSYSTLQESLIYILLKLKTDHN